jgi:hypothetical protein
MQRTWRTNLNAALLSFVLPGWGQFEQRRTGLARLQMAWAIVALLLLMLAPALPWPRALTLIDWALVAAWSVADALAWRGAA